MFLCFYMCNYAWLFLFFTRIQYRIYVLHQMLILLSRAQHRHCLPINLYCCHRPPSSQSFPHTSRYVSVVITLCTLLRIYMLIYMNESGRKLAHGCVAFYIAHQVNEWGKRVTWDAANLKTGHPQVSSNFSIAKGLRNQRRNWGGALHAPSSQNYPVMPMQGTPPFIPHTNI